MYESTDSVINALCCVIVQNTTAWNLNTLVCTTLSDTSKHSTIPHKRILTDRGDKCERMFIENCSLLAYQENKPLKRELVRQVSQSIFYHSEV